MLCQLDAIFKWCIITFLSFISFYRRVLIVFNVIWVIFNLMFILLTSFNIWIMSLWISISMSCWWVMYLIKMMMSSVFLSIIQAFSSSLMLILIISWSKSNAFVFFSSIFNNAFISSSSDAVQFCDRSDSLLEFWSS